MVNQGQGHRPLSILKRLRARAFSISPREASFQVRGFRADLPALREHLETIGRTFLSGYHAALEDRPLEELALRLHEVDEPLQGFAFEGAAMGLGLLERLSFSGGRFASFLNGPGKPHAYMLHVGLGWAMARIPWGMRQTFARLDPVLRWLAVDGYGFHEGYFHFRRYAGGKNRPQRADEYWPRAFAQGFGRSLWFVMGTHAGRIAKTIEAFDQRARADLWSGVGLAATYAGGCGEETLASLKAHAADYLPHLAQGSVFAVGARLRAGNQTSHMHLACETICGISADEAGELVETTKQNLPHDRPEPAYEIWRQRIANTIGAQIGAGRR